MISEITLAVTLKAKADIICEDLALSKTVSTRNLNKEHYEMINKVALEIDKLFDKIDNDDRK